MDLQSARQAKETAERVAVNFPGIHHKCTKCGVIVDIKQKLRSSRVKHYATIRWFHPTTRGDMESDVILGRVQPVSRALGQC